MCVSVSVSVSESVSVIESESASVSEGVSECNLVPGTPPPQEAAKNRVLSSKMSVRMVSYLTVTCK